MKLSEMVKDSSRYLTAKHLPDGWTKLLTIRHVRVEVMDDEEERIVVFFKEYEGETGGWVLNKTARHFLIEAFGDDVDALIGNQLVLFKTETDFKGQRVPCIRPRMPKKQKLSELDSDESSPF